MSIALRPFLYTSSVVWLLVLAGCSSLDSGRLVDEPEEPVASARAALSVDLTPTTASNVSDLRNRTGGEFGIEKACDGSLSTKTNYPDQKFWVQYRMTGPSVIKSYQFWRSPQWRAQRPP